MYGHIGKILLVNLSDQTYEIQDLNPDWARDFVGGPSLGARYLYELMPANTPVFAPESVIGYVTGPTNGAKVFMGGRYTVVSKSPVTNGFNDSSSGGNFGPYIKKAGFDAIFVKGISEKPVYLFIDDRKVEFRDATKLWGMRTIATEHALREEIGDKNICAALIGPGGERLSNMAAVMNDEHRAAGRGGAGAVMGSKKLKAVVCRGTHTTPVMSPEEVTAINKAWGDFATGPDAHPFTSTWRVHGTPATYDSCVMISDAGIKNWGGTPEDMDYETEVLPLSGKVMDERFKIRKYACNTCQFGCGAIYHVKSEKHGYDIETGRPEYETLGTFGSLLLNSDAECTNICNYLCNEYGFDTVSLGNTISWLMECYENGLFTIDELDGVDLRWGNAEAIVKMAEKICEAQGIGAVLNGASVAAADALGRGHEYLVVAGGIEIPHHCARNNPAMARTYKFDPTPGRHVKGGRGAGLGFAPPAVKYVFDGVGEDDKNGTIGAEYDNLSGFCHFCFFLKPGDKYNYMNAVTGHNYSKEDFDKMSLRSYAMRSAFNIREGFNRKDCTISDRIIGIPALTKGPLAGITIPVDYLGDQFYEAINWHVDTGVPTKEFLEDVGGLDVVIRDMYPE